MDPYLWQMATALMTPSCLGGSHGTADNGDSYEHSGDEMEVSSSESSDSDDETTIRPHVRTAPATDVDAASPFAAVQQLSEGRLPIDIRTVQIALALSQLDNAAAADGQPVEAPKLKDQTRAQQPSVSGEDGWYVEYAKSAASVVVNLGPFEYDELFENLELDEEAVSL